MHFIVHCLDKPDMVDSRLANYDAHKTYLAALPPGLSMVMSGPLLADDQRTMIGSLFLFEADDVSIVQDFNRRDPFQRAGLWQQVEIHPFLKRVDNR